MSEFQWLIKLGQLTEIAVDWIELMRKNIQEQSLLCSDCLNMVYMYLNTLYSMAKSCMYNHQGMKTLCLKLSNILRLQQVIKNHSNKVLCLKHETVFSTFWLVTIYTVVNYN